MADPMRIRAQAAGDKATVRVLMSHEMESGQRKDASGKLVPAWHISDVTARLNGQRTILGQEVLSLAVDELVEVGSKVVAESAKQPLTRTQPQALKQGEEGKVIPTPRLQPAPDSALPKTGTQEDKFLPLAGLAFLGMGLLAGRKKQED